MVKRKREKDKQFLQNTTKKLILSSKNINSINGTGYAIRTGAPSGKS
jgi:hypothetical protein